jgi:drug/metabolite transporter (DMT)-like permease
MNRARIYPVVIVLAAAFLSGLSVPISRLLLNRIEPVLMSALLYLGSAAGLIILVYLRRIARYPGSADIKTGSIRFNHTWRYCRPILLMSSLRVTPPATASLLLNFESVATALIAATFFHESVGWRVVFAVAFITVPSGASY